MACFDHISRGQSPPPCIALCEHPQDARFRYISTEPIRGNGIDHANTRVAQKSRELHAFSPFLIRSSLVLYQPAERSSDCWECRNHCLKSAHRDRICANSGITSFVLELEGKSAHTAALIVNHQWIVHNWFVDTRCQHTYKTQTSESVSVRHLARSHAFKSVKECVLLIFASLSRTCLLFFRNCLKL